MMQDAQNVDLVGKNKITGEVEHFIFSFIPPLMEKCILDYVPCSSPRVLPVADVPLRKLTKWPAF
jgi:hypothetical protein